MAATLRIGVDIGGTKIEIAALDPDGAEQLKRRIATPHGAYDAAISELAEFIAGFERDIGGAASIGIGIPGTLSPQTGLVTNAHETPFNRHAFKRDIESRLQREVSVANDANCFALSEALDGAARGRRVVFGAILGTGVGAGIVVDGRMLTGANAICGEWGHNPLPWMEPGEYPGPDCYCGRTGCIERFVSGPALAADHARSTGEMLDPATIAAGASAGDTICAETLHRFERRLARAMAHVINLLDPEIIVLGGGLSNLSTLYENVPRMWRDYVYSNEVQTQLVRAAHGDASGVRGAARLPA